MLRIDKRAGTLRAAVPKGRFRSVTSITIRHRLRAITIRVHDEPQPDIQRVLERLVEQPFAVATGHLTQHRRRHHAARSAELRFAAIVLRATRDPAPIRRSALQQNLQERFVEPAQLANRPARAAARPARREILRRVPKRMHAKLRATRVIHHPHPFAVARELFLGHAQPQIAQTERLKNFLPHIASGLASVDASNQFTQHHPAGNHLVARLLSRHPTLLQRRPADTRDHFVPRQTLSQLIRFPKPSGVRQQMTNGDGLLAALREFRQMLADRIIEAQPPTFHELPDGNRRDRFPRREPERQRVRSHHHARPRLAERDVGDHLATPRHIQLRAPDAKWNAAPAPAGRVSAANYRKLHASGATLRQSLADSKRSVRAVKRSAGVSPA
jgi:hypothetical protein